MSQDSTNTDWFDTVIARLVCLEIALFTLLEEATGNRQQAASLRQRIVDTIQSQDGLSDSHKERAILLADGLFPSLPKMKP